MGACDTFADANITLFAVFSKDIQKTDAAFYFSFTLPAFFFPTVTAAIYPYKSLMNSLFQGGGSNFSELLGETAATTPFRRLSSYQGKAGKGSCIKT